MPEPDTDIAENEQDDSPNGMIVHAEPTKEFFIDMLVRDITLTRAIVDLIDNSVDGARRTRPNGDYNGLWIEVTAGPNQFVVKDNCGGIPLEIARHYAFRFGRPPQMQATPHSVGQFGVGMKRALFKLGSRFRVSSSTINNRFEIDEDVRQWQVKPEWTFEFSDIADEPTDTQGTTISVTHLHEGVQAEFQLDSFHAQLSAAIRDAHIDSLETGLSITYNGTPLLYEPLDLLTAQGFEPALFETSMNGATDTPPISVKAYAGLGASDPQHAGWNIFCNGRLVLGSDQTEVTGWGEGNGRTIPKYHNQFARFRGYVFFDCDDAGKLPWNTTKSGVDSDSTAYRSVRLQMITLMRPVINFLNQLDKEKDNPDDHKPLHGVVESMRTVALREADVRPRFTYPRPPPRPPSPPTGRIQYNKPVEEISLVKKSLGVTTYSDVGRGTFEYYFDRECT